MGKRVTKDWGKGGEEGWTRERETASTPFPTSTAFEMLLEYRL